MDLPGHAWGLEPLPGGYSGETFVAEAAGERSVVRIYSGRGAARGPHAIEVDAAVLRLVRGLVPVPEVLEARRADASAGTPALLVTSWLTGERLDDLLPNADEHLVAALGSSLGLVLAVLAGMPMLRAGAFADAELRIGSLPAGGDDLRSWVEQHSATGPLSEWGVSDLTGLQTTADRAQSLLDLSSRTCLVHGDFNPKNLLVDRHGTVTGVLDWEFAHAGGPLGDLGNLLRFERDPVFTEAVLRAFADRVPDGQLDLDDLLTRARAADLFALVELAARVEQSPVVHRARDHLLAVARTGDLHATP